MSVVFPIWARHRYIIVRDVVERGPDGQQAVRNTESMEVTIAWPEDRTGWAAPSEYVSVGEWRILNPPPIGFHVPGSNKPAGDTVALPR
jgi:hypothetical protein